MEPTQSKYPIFEANQVLSNSHLNQLFSYLDEQERLTRANLIGIGIVCGLEIRLERTASAATIHLSKGCGVTSEGYLAVEPEDVALVSYREEYKLPSAPEYPPFLRDKSPPSKAPYVLCELFPAGEPNTKPLQDPPGFLDDKAVVLFLELKEEGLRNCSPNECNDKGSQVTATLRRLLIGKTDLDKIIAEANGLTNDLTSTDLTTTLSARLNLPDVCLPRYDAPNTGPATTHEVLAAFHAVFHDHQLARNTGKALSSAYDAFKPLLQGMYPSNPFADFDAKLGFLDTAPETTAQVRFLQYYQDFFDDLLKGYDEFRWKGFDLLCACCPPAELFPRHLMLGVLFPSAVADPGLYRHRFMSSPAIGGCEERTKELKLLFQRLVEMVHRFTHAPPLRPSSTASRTDEQVQITPGKWGDVPLSQKAIPYYYLQDGDPPLYRLWNAERNFRNRAGRNLSYRSYQYSPPPPPFVADPLHYDLEPHPFLRIEGHLGKDVRSVLQTLLALKSRHRLPIEIIALRTGAYDEDLSVDLSKETCRFQDLEALYDSLREELLSTLCEGVMYFYDLPVASSELPGGAPQLPLLKKCAPNFRVKAGTVGAWYEQYVTLFQSRPYIDIDQSKVDGNEVLTVYCALFTGTSGLPAENYVHVVSVYYLTRLADLLPDGLDELAFADFQNKYQDLLGLIRFFRSDARKSVSPELEKFIPQEDLIDHCDHLLFSCKLAPARAIHEEYVNRIRQIKQKQFLSVFLQKHPGIQHKAGVPLGGTFIVVYHEEPKAQVVDAGRQMGEIGARIAGTSVSGRGKASPEVLSGAFKRIRVNPKLAADPDVRIILGALTGQVPDFDIVVPPARGDKAARIIAAAVDELSDGTVVADFFLPYLCCSDCPPVQYVLPLPPLGLSVALGCTDPETLTAEATLTPQGGMAPMTYKLDEQPFKELTGKIVLPVGPHTLVIRDSSGAESAPQSLTVPEPLTIGAASYTDDVPAQTYRVSFTVSGGTPPYVSDFGAVSGTAYTSESVKSGDEFGVTIGDSVGCKRSEKFIHTVPPPCDLPCDGKARRCGYRFWLPPPEQKRPYNIYNADVAELHFIGPEGMSIDLSSDVKQIIQASPDDLNNDFTRVVESWLSNINELIFKVTDRMNWLQLSYSKDPRDSVGTLWIEYFECLDFELHILCRFRRSESLEELDTFYTPSGTLIKNLEVKMPPYNCVEINKCDPRHTIVNRCKEVDLALEIMKKVGNRGRTASLAVAPSGLDQLVAYLWEVQDGIPALTNQQEATVSFEQMEPTTKIIRLTAFTKEGCRVTVVDQVQLG
jgi:hypothetical protein